MNTKTARQTMKPTKRQDWKRSYESKIETLRRKEVRTNKYSKTEVTL